MIRPLGGLHVPHGRHAGSDHPAAALRRIGLTALVAGPGAGLLSACATSGGGAAPRRPASPGAVSAAEPVRRGRQAKPLEVVIFKGGLGDEYATEVHEPMYKRRYPQATIKHDATQQIAQTLQPRFASGDVPDMIDNSGADLMDQGALAPRASCSTSPRCSTRPRSTTRARRSATPCARHRRGRPRSTASRTS